MGIMADDTRIVRVQIPQPASAYEVRIGCGLLSQTGHLVGAVCPDRSAAMVFDQRLADTHARTVLESLTQAGYEVVQCAIDGTEAAKSLDTVRRLFDRFLSARLERTSPVVAVGGGVIGDTAGFAAATYLRGVPFINIPTTLLSMVDAAIGGKTAVNIALSASPDSVLGKNLIGAFHQPALVIADVESLATLAPRQIRAGLAECVKHGLLGDAALFDWLELNADRWDALTATEIASLIERNVRLKIRIVEDDVRESRLRMLLNLGHTFAHAIETREELGLGHGEAVSIGLAAACAAGIAMNLTPPEVLDRCTDLLRRIGLPVAVANLPENDVLIQKMGTDKKVRDRKIRIVIPTAIGAARIIDDAPMSAIRSGWDHVRTADP